MGSLKLLLSQKGAIQGPRFSAIHRKRLIGSWMDGWSAGPSLRRAPGGPRALESNDPLLSPLPTAALRPLSSVPRAGLHDLPRRLGLRDDPGHVRGQDREVLPGGLFGALGVHPGHHRHPQRTYPLLPRLRAGQPADRPASGGAQARQQRRVGVSGWAAGGAG